jgi:hypothetical protein
VTVSGIVPFNTVCPPFVTVRNVEVVDPIANAGPVIPLGLIDSCAHGVDVASPSLDVKLLMLLNVLKSDSSVEEADVPDDVSIHTRPDDVVFSVPTVVVDSVNSPVVRFVVEAVVNDPYVVDENANLFRPLQKFESDSSVDEADDPDPDKQLPLIAKHPPVRLKPTLDVDVAKPAIFNPDTVVVPNPTDDTESCVAVDEPTYKPYKSPEIGLIDSLAERLFEGELEEINILFPRDSDVMNRPYVDPETSPTDLPESPLKTAPPTLESKPTDAL